MTPTLSVIIPIYKVEDYLERCVLSVINQDYRDIEVILVDDGSPDRCPQICDELAKKDNRIVVIHKPNGGLSSARNAGIDVATGKYLAFLDSDDQWAEGKLMQLMKEVNLAISPVIIYASTNLYPNGQIYQRYEPHFFTGELRELETTQIYHEFITAGNLHESACTKIVNRKFIVNNDLKFRCGMLCEDTEWMFRILRQVKTVSVSSIPLFICTENRIGSITNTASTRSINDMLYIIESSINFYSNKPNSATKSFELAHCSYLWSICVGLYNTIPSSDRPKIKRRLHQAMKSLDMTSHPKSSKVYKLYHFLGLYITAKILGLYLILLRNNIINRKLKA